MLLSFSVIDFNLKTEEKNLLILYFFLKKIMFFQSLFGPKDHPIYLGAEYGLGKKIHLFHGLDLLTYIKYDFHGLGFKPIELVYILNHSYKLSTSKHIGHGTKHTLFSSYIMEMINLVPNYIYVSTI